ncbi:MAG: cadherin-like beta sandwich domain-containing protein [Ruminococcus sp.]|nr:cadherin-like beta sandwich domain-containing protein [Ruminococcus sp.]
MKKISKLIKIFLIVALLLVEIPVVSAAGSSTLSLNGATTVNVGKNIDITFALSGVSGANGGIAGIEGHIEYDKTQLELVDAVSKAPFSVLFEEPVISGTSGSKSTRITGSTADFITFTFKAKAEGTATITVKNTEVSDGMGDILSSNNPTKTITIGTASNNAFLSSLGVTGYTLSPTFNKNTTTYSVTVPNSVASATITATAEDGKAKVTNTGSKNLTAGQVNKFTVKVTAEDGTTKDYIVNITREKAPETPKSTDNTLKSLGVENYEISPNFDKNTTDYSISVPSDVNDIKVNATANDSKAKVEITGNTGLKTGENTVTVKVTAEDGSTKVYNIKVNKQDEKKSNDSDLKGLGVSGYEISPSFNKDTLEYTVEVPNDATEVIVNAIPNDGKAKVEVTGNTNLKEGENEVTVKVTAEDGTTKEYKIKVNKKPKENAPKLDNDATLKNLSVGSGTLSPKFSKDNFVYSVEVPSGTTNLDVSAIPNSDKAKVEIIGNTGLKNGMNTVQVKVTAEDGTTYNYIINVNRKSSTNTTTKSNDNYLSNLGVSGFAISPSFNKDNPNYTITVPYDVEKLDLYYTTSNNKAKVKIIGNDELLVGKVNTVQVQVTAEDGSVRVYTINATRSAKESDNKLKELSTGEFKLSPSFDKDIYNYTVKVKPGTDKLDLTAIAESSDAKVEILGNENFKTGNNTVLVKVTDKNGFTRIYQIDVEKPARTIFGMSIGQFIMTLLLLLGLLGLFFLILILFKRRKDDEEKTVVVNTPPQPQVPIIDFKPEFNFGSRNGTDDDVVFGGASLNQGSTIATNSEPKKMLDVAPEADYEEIDDELEDSLNNAALYDETITKDELVRAIKEGMRTKNPDKLKMLLKQDELNQLKKKIKRDEAKKTRSGKYDE